MLQLFSRAPVSLAASLGVLLCGCSMAPSTVSPTQGSFGGPVFTTSATRVALSGTVVTGTAAAPAPSLGMTLSAGVGAVMVSVVGTGIGAVTDATGAFVLPELPAGPQTLQLTGNGVAAQVVVPAVGAAEHLDVTILVSGNQAILDDSHREALGTQDVEVEGVVNAVSGTTLFVGRVNRPVVVPPSAVLTGGTSADLVAGVRIEAHGIESGGTLTATSVAIRGAAGVPPSSQGRDGNTGSTGGTEPEGRSDPSRSARTSVKGTVTLRPSGTCPAISFTVGVQKVKTDASTQFEHSSCAGLTTGVMVEVEGALQTDGTLLAAEVSASDDANEGSDTEHDDDGGTTGRAGTSGSSR